MHVQSPAAVAHVLCLCADDDLSTFLTLRCTGLPNSKNRQALLRLCCSLCQCCTKHCSHHIRDEEERATDGILLVRHVYNILCHTLTTLFCLGEPGKQHLKGHFERCDRRPRYSCEPCNQKYGSGPLHFEFDGKSCHVDVGALLLIVIRACLRHCL